MYDYETLRESHGTKVSQTIDSPILVFDYFEMTEVFAALLVMLIFGVIFYSWSFMLLFLVLILGIGPQLRRRNKKGIYFHWPYKKFHMSLPGLINPKGRKKYSD
ncbi:MAG: hypothetical protein COW00_02765 [Bdellovibrio sp. CG12_big_fil_rev_8_21_14_0_65_39_13]|nr:MAG: hypothetical protein COW78_16205 [Bdellovibrio sp. CG22_combo_CG10-13_8_21_14_all_39_27]PIQ61818.1 MAG: hypothetical protein COW00_02765 [Bdellovibrio sp. CG12_big_fil_rev_8_21_14_0_65_39_13]PIR35171.1 MAG: hypothetical protein COV37_09950 [Bdellovibrio sp. CG11_big_fil_rev_8_21_14_0_20_39_38]